MLDFDMESNLNAVIRVIGVGGGGGNAVNNMIRSGLSGVEFVSANTDAQSLQSNLASIKLQIGGHRRTQKDSESLDEADQVLAGVESTDIQQIGIAQAVAGTHSGLNHRLDNRCKGLVAPRINDMNSLLGNAVIVHQIPSCRLRIGHDTCGGTGIVAG